MQGRVVAGRYRLDEPIGDGAMGSVWRAEHLALGTPVAVKLIHAETARNPDALARFEREAKVAARIRSNHVVTMLDHGHDGGQPFIVMEYLQGESLSQRLARVGRLTVRETEQVVTHVCRALAQAHELGLVHRDIKPGNVFVVPTEDGGESHKVLDFGLAKATDQLSFGDIQTKTGALLGTPFYMSPEQAQGLRSLDYRSDLWSVAIMCFECLTGGRPFHAKGVGPLTALILAGTIPSPSASAPQAEIPPAVDAWMVKALCRDPAGRFGSARELAETFQTAASLSADQGLESSWPAHGEARGPSSASAAPAGEESLDDMAATIMLPEGGKGAPVQRAASAPAIDDGADLQKTLAIASNETVMLADPRPVGAPIVAAAPMAAAPTVGSAVPSSGPSPEPGRVSAAPMATAAEPWRADVVPRQSNRLPIVIGVALAVLLAGAAWLLLGGMEPRAVAPDAGSSSPTVAVDSRAEPAPTATPTADEPEASTAAAAASSSAPASAEPESVAAPPTGPAGASEPAPPRGCTKDTECPGNEVCVSKQCTAPAPKAAVNSCTKDTDCPGDTVCVKRQCTAPIRKAPAKSCTKDTDCPGNEICVRGRCRAGG